MVAKAKTNGAIGHVNGRSNGEAPSTSAQEDDLRKPGRWMLVDEHGAPRRIAGRHVLVCSGLPAFARVLAARWLVSKGASLDEADLVRVVEWKPNGWVPDRAVIIGATAGGVSERLVELAGGR